MQIRLDCNNRLKLRSSWIIHGSIQEKNAKYLEIDFLLNLKFPDREFLEWTVIWGGSYS